MDPQRMRSYLQLACSVLGFDIGEIWLTSSPSGSSAAVAIPSSSSSLRFVQLYTSQAFDPDLILNPDVENNQHVLSPRMVSMIKNSARAVWATTKKQEGLTGKSELNLQTAVGMPVAMDNSGNMCVVVMFSRNRIPRDDDATQYLDFVSRSAGQTRIPMMNPVLTGNFQNVPHLEIIHNSEVQNSVLGEGVTTQFVDLDRPNVKITEAPKDSFGIPMLPDFESYEMDSAFDEASYGIWNYVMQNQEPAPSTSGQELQVHYQKPVAFSEQRRRRLIEFLDAFLEMSVYDAADIWIVSNEYKDSLRQITHVGHVLHEFRDSSQHVRIHLWDGLIGRAYSTGNPLMSGEMKSFADQGRRELFARAKIQNVLAIPIENCVVACYSCVHSQSVPFVLKFVQQALRVLWKGTLQECHPADLGEMAADIEMQDHFHHRPTIDVSIADIGHHINQAVATVDSAIVVGSASQPAPLNPPSQFPQAIVPRIIVPQQPSYLIQPGQPSSPPPPPTVQMHIQQKRPPSAAPIDLNEAVFCQPIAVPSARQTTVTTLVPESARICKVIGCSNAAAPRRAHCSRHTGSRECAFAGCTKCAQGTTQYCIAHGGGRRCTFPGCDKGARDKFFCAAHGGGRRCQRPGCTKSAVGRSNLCTAHGGGRRCSVEHCNKAAQSSTNFCVKHGGGKKCARPNCTKVARGKTNFCAAHGGGVRCKLEGCDRVAIGKLQLCRAHGGRSSRSTARNPPTALP